MALAGWDASKKIAITIPQQTETLTDRDLTILLSASSGLTNFDCSPVFTELGVNRKRIAVEVGDTGVQCYVELPTNSWDNVSGTAVLKVKVPAVSSSGATVLNLYYDNTQADNTTYVGDTGEAAAQSVWDANYLASYNHEQDPSGGAGCILDSTSNARHCTPVGTMLSEDLVAGAVGKALDFDGSSQHYPIDLGAAQTEATVELIVKAPAPAVYDSPFGRTTDATSGSMSLNVASSTQMALYQQGGSQRCAVDADWTSWLHLSFSVDAAGATLTNHNTGVTATFAATNLSIRQEMAVAYWYTASRHWPGSVDEVRISGVKRSDVWRHFTYLAATDQLLTLSAAGVTTLLAIVDMPYDLSTGVLRQLIDMPYAVLFPHMAIVDMIYGIKLAAMLSMYYGDCPGLRQINNMYYSDCAILRRSMEMKYGDLLMLRQSMEMPYVIPRELRAVVESRYSIAGEAVRAFIDQGYDLLDNNLLRQKLEQIYMIQGDGLVKSVGAQVTIGGRVVKCSHVNVEASLDQYCISGEIHLADQADYVQIEGGEEMVITIDVDGGVDSYHLIVDAKRRSRPGGAKITYIVTGLSPAVKLSAPWSLPLLQEFEPGQARDIVNDLVGDLGPVDWQIVDFPVLPDTLYANDEDPITVIRKLTRSAGAVIQSAPDGTIRIVPAYPTSPPQWAEVDPDFYLTERDLVTQDETPIRNPGYNKYLVGNQLTADDRKWTEQRDVTGSIKEVLAFQTPWDWSLPVVLDHSGGDWVAVPEYMGVVEELYPPADEPAEQVEFVAGFANTSRPIYAVPEVNWIREQLGAVSYSEDGKLEAELKTGATDGYSLAEIRYLTRYHLWRVRDDVAEDVQYILRVADEVTA